MDQETIENRYKDRNFILLDIYKNNHTKLKTQCFCGNIFYSIPSNIFNSHCKSCGCLYQEWCKKRPKKNLQNLRFGKLLVVKLDKLIQRNNGKTRKYWLCKCDCGKTSSVLQDNLTRKHTQSCGNCCLYRNGRKISNLQLKLYKMVNKGVLNFKSSKYCIDIALVYNGVKIAIEYDSYYFHKNRLHKDNEKYQYLLNNNWRIIQIKSGELLPNDCVLKQAILNAKKCSHTIIQLADWR